MIYVVLLLPLFFNSFSIHIIHLFTSLSFWNAASYNPSGGQSENDPNNTTVRTSFNMLKPCFVCYLFVTYLFVADFCWQLGSKCHWRSSEASFHPIWWTSTCEDSIRQAMRVCPIFGQVISLLYLFFLICAK